MTLTFQYINLGQFIYLFKSNINAEKYTHIKYMYGEFSQNKDIHVTSIRLKKKKRLLPTFQKPLLFFEGTGQGS